MSEGYVDGGKLEIQVVADLKGLASELRTGVPAAAKGITAKIGVDLRPAGLKTALRAAVKLASAGVSAKVGIEIDSRGVKTALRTALKGVELSVPVKLDPVATGLKAKLKALAKANDVTITAKVVPAKGAAKALRQAEEQSAAEQKLRDSLLSLQKAVFGNEDAFTAYSKALRENGKDSDQAERSATRHADAQNTLNKRFASTAELLGKIGESDSLDIDTSHAEQQMETIGRRAERIRETLAELGDAPAPDTAATERQTRQAEDAVNRLRAALNNADRSSQSLQAALDKQAIATRDMGKEGEDAAVSTQRLRNALLGSRDAADKNTEAIQRAKRELTDLQTLAKNNPTINFDADITAAQARLAELERNRDITLTADLDAGGAEARLAALERPRKATVNVDADTGKAAADIDLLSSGSSFAEARVLALAGAIALIGPAIAPIGAAAVGALAGLAALAGAAAAGIGVLVLSFSGISTAVKALSDASKDSGKTAKSLADQSYRTASATDSVTAATEALASARASAANSATTAANRIASAERDSAEATLRAKDAQLALTQAQVDARQAAEDLVLQVRGGALAQRSATLEQARAKTALDKVLKDPKATKDARAEAQLSYDQAVLNLDEQTLRNKRLQAEQAKSAKEGITGAAGVQRALKGVRTAQTSVSDAELAITEARRASANQARQSAASIAAAQRGLVTAQRNLAKSTADYGTAGSAALDKVRKAMEGQSPAFQKFAEFLFGLKGQFDELKNTAQSKLFPGLEDGIKALLPIMPRLNKFVGAVAGTLGNLFRAGGQALSSPFWTDFLDYMTRTGGPFLESLGGILADVAKGFASLILAFEPVSKAFIGGLSGMARSFADWAAGLKNNAGFQKFLNYIIKAGPEVVNTLIALTRALIQIGEGLAPLGDLVLRGLTWLGEAIAGIPPDILTAVGAGIMAVVAALIIFNGVAALAVALATGTGAAIAAIGVGLAVLAAAFIYAWEHSRTFRDTVTEAFDTIRFVAEDVWSVLQGILTDLGLSGDNAGDMLISAMEGAAAAFKAFADGVEYNWNTIVKPLLEGDFAKVGDEAAFFAAKLRDSERRLADAQADSLTAQDKLNDSRATAADRAKELAQRERDLRGDLTGAGLNVRETRLRLADVKKEVGAKPKSEKDKLSLDQAQYAYDEAVKREQGIRQEIVKTKDERHKAAVEAKTGSAEALAGLSEAHRKEVAAGQAAVNAKKAQDIQRGTSDGSFWGNMKMRADNVFDDIKTKAQEVWGGIESFINGVGERLNNATGGGLNAFLDAVKERFTFLKTLFTSVKDTLGNVFSAIKTAVGSLSPVFDTVAKNVSFAWDGIKLGAGILWAFLKIIFGLIQIGIKFLGSVFAGLYYDYIKPAFTSVYTFLLGIWTSKIKPILDTIADFIKNDIAPKWQAGANILQGIFDKLRDVLAKPIVWVVDNVLNGFLFKGYNELATKFGVKPNDVHIDVPASLRSSSSPSNANGTGRPLPGGGGGGSSFATGGPVYGPGTSTSDSIVARLSDDEHVWTAREVRAAGGHNAVMALRQAALQGQVQIPGFASGGGVTSFLRKRLQDAGGILSGVVGKGRELLGQGADAMAAPLRTGMRALLDVAPTGSSPFMQLIRKLPEKLLNGAISYLVGNAAPAVTGDGTAVSPSLRSQMNLNSVSAIVEMARKFLPGAQLSSGLRDTDDLHGRGLAADLIGGGAAGMKRMAEGFYGISGSLLQLIHSAAPGFFVANGQRVGPDYYRSVLAGHYNHVHVAATVPALAAASAGGTIPANAIAGLPASVTRWSPLVLKALGELGQSASLAPGVLRRIKFESGGNPAAINLTDSNARAGHPSQGLMQTIPSTFAAHAGPYRSRGINDPLANIYAGLHYALGRYGSINAIDPLIRPFGYDSGGKLAPGWSSVYNGTGKPEAVLTHEQWQTLAALASAAVLPAAAMRGSYAGQITGRSVPATAAATAPAPAPVINVYPRASQSEREIGRIVNRELEWSRGPS